MSPSKPGEKFYMDQVFAGDITVDHEVQRDLNANHVNSIRRNIDEAAMGVIYLSRREDGAYHCMDGQHRVAAMKELDPSFVFNALVFEGLTVEREAELFIRFNEGRKAVTPFDKFDMHLRFGDQPHTDIHHMLRSMGLDIGQVSSTNRVGAVAKLVSLTNSFGLESLQLALATLSSTWSRSKDSWRGELIGAVTRIYYFNPHIVMDDLRTALQTNEPMSWVAMKDKGASTGTDADRSIARYMVERYNKTKRGKARISSDPHKS